MSEPARRTQTITVAIPASLTLDIPHLREKTSRLGFVSRALATFRIEHAIIYHDRPSKEIEREATLIEKLLGYIETPQYLRKLLYKTDPDLQYAGTLPPLRTPNHPNKQVPTTGQFREGVVVQDGPPSTIDAGYHQPVRAQARLRTLQRVTVRLTRASHPLEGEIIDPSRLTIYWGFKVARGHNSLAEIMRSGKFDLTISTSRKGQDIREKTPDLQQKWKSSKNPLIAFGSPSEGLEEIFARSNVRISSVSDFYLNTIHDQGVATVRTEEALWSTLAVLNTLEAE